MLDVRLPDIHRRRGQPADQGRASRHRGAADLGRDHQFARSGDRAGWRGGWLSGGADRTRGTAGHGARSLLRMRGAEQALRRLNESLELLRRRAHARAHRGQSTAGNRDSPNAAKPKRCFGTRRSWRRSASSPAASPMTSTICSRSSSAAWRLSRRPSNSDGDLPRAKILRLLKASEAATGRATKLTQQLLAFARRSTFTLDIVSLDEVLVGVRTVPAAGIGRVERARASTSNLICGPAGSIRRSSRRRS